MRIPQISQLVKEKEFAYLLGFLWSDGYATCLPRTARIRIPGSIHPIPMGICVRKRGIYSARCPSRVDRTPHNQSVDQTAGSPFSRRFLACWCSLRCYISNPISHIIGLSSHTTNVVIFNSHRKEDSHSFQIQASFERQPLSSWYLHGNHGLHLRF